MAESEFIATATADNEAQVQQPVNSPSLIIDKMNQHKLLVFGLCDKHGNLFEGDTVVCMPIDGEKSIESQWQTPFENSNPEHKLPSLSAGIQSGQILESMGAMGGILGEAVGAAASLTSPVTGAITEGLKGLEGKTNLTKINTEQIFLSTASVNLNLSIFFIALRDAKEEVEKQIMLLESWAVPKYLHDQTVLVSVSNNGIGGLFPSEVPPFISVTTHGKTYKPFVISSVSAPIISPIDKQGNRLSVTVNISLLSRTAWDANDIRKLYGYGA